MPIDLYRDGDHYVLSADLPGIDPGSVDVGVDGHSLTIRAERTPRGREGVKWIARERPTGSFCRQFTLGEGIATEGITASFVSVQCSTWCWCIQVVQFTSGVSGDPKAPPSSASDTLAPCKFGKSTLCCGSSSCSWLA